MAHRWECKYGIQDWLFEANRAWKAMPTVAIEKMPVQNPASCRIIAYQGNDSCWLSVELATLGLKWAPGLEIGHKAGDSYESAVLGSSWGILGNLLANARPSYTGESDETVAAKAGCGKAHALGKNVALCTNVSSAPTPCQQPR